MTVTEALVDSVRERLIRAGHVLVSGRYRDPMTSHTVISLTDGRTVFVSDRDALAGPPTIFADRVRAAGAVPTEDLDTLIALIRTEKGWQ